MQADGKADGEEKPAGLVGRLFGGGGKRYRAAKMGGELDMYYNDEVRCATTRDRRAVIAAIPAAPGLALHSRSLSTLARLLCVQLKCWVERGQEEAKRKELAALSAPPPKAMSAASLAGGAAAEDAGPAASSGPPVFAGARVQQRIGVATRYAAAPNLAAATSEASGGSFMSGEPSAPRTSLLTQNCSSFFLVP